MANISFNVSGGWRVSSLNGGTDVLTKAVSATYTGSAVFTQQVVLTPTMSEYLVSLPQFSAPVAILMTATNVVRVNFGGQASSVSAASASVMQFKDVFMMAAASAALPSGIHLGNSGVDSAAVTICVIQ